MWTTLNYGGRSKTNKWAKDICRGGPSYRMWTVGLGATLGNGLKIKNNFSSFRDFSGKADSVILLGFEYRPTINPQHLIKIVGAIFEKINFFFLMWTTLNFRGRGKIRKMAQDICKGTRLVIWFRRYVRRRTEN